MLQICASGRSSNELGVDPGLRDKRCHHSVTCADRVDICGHDNATNTKLTAEIKELCLFYSAEKEGKSSCRLVHVSTISLSSSEEGVSAWMLPPQAVMGACTNQLILQKQPGSETKLWLT